MSELIKTILLIDDDEVDRQRVQRLLGKRYEVHEAELGDEGLGRFLQQRPDCVLLDYMLPDVNDLDLLDHLVRRGATVVMLTGQGNEQTAVEVMKHGAQDYLVKDSIDAESLHRAISNAVDKASMRHKIQEQQDQLKKHAEELQRSNQELQQFAYVASHDLQEPLRSVSSFCNLLQEEYAGKFDEQADRWMKRIVGGANRMKTMIQDLLCYSRVETQGQQFQPTDLTRILQEVEGNYAVELKRCAAQLTFDKLPTVMADESQMFQLLQNLVGNALKYCGDRPPAVHIAAVGNDHEWTISVSDNGIGINGEYFETIFQMFKRLHRRNEYPGTGIGLALCQRIVNRHGGRIWVESEPGQGSVFYFSIPAMIKDEEHECPTLAHAN